MRACWIDSGNDPDWVKVKAHEMTHLYFDLFDSRVRTSYLHNVTTRGYGVGVYVVTNWPQVAGQDGKTFAETVSKQLGVVVPAVLGDVASFPKVQLDIEQHDPVFILEALKRWRELRPKRDTSWTFEGSQSGWMSPEFVAEVISRRVRLVPQLYNGAMTEVWDSLTEARELVAAGFPDGLISPFYDAAHLPVGWSGFAFTMGRLP